MLSSFVDKAKNIENFTIKSSYAYTEVLSGFTVQRFTHSVSVVILHFVFGICCYETEKFTKGCRLKEHLRGTQEN